MAWDGILRTFKDAASATKQVITDTTASATEDVPLYKIVYGPHGSDPLRVLRTNGLPIVGQRTSGSPASTRLTNSTAAVTGNGNTSAIGGTGGTAVPGTFVLTAIPDNTSLVVIGDTNINAFTGQVRGLPLSPGQTYVIDTDDLRTWKLSVRTSGDGVTWIQVGA